MQFNNYFELQTACRNFFADLLVRYPLPVFITQWLGRQQLFKAKGLDRIKPGRLMGWVIA